MVEKVRIALGPVGTGYFHSRDSVQMFEHWQLTEWDGQGEPPRGLPS